MKVPTNPPESIATNDWRALVAASKNELFSTPQVLTDGNESRFSNAAKESANQH